MQHIPQPHEIYRHFKGNTYQIVTLAEHSETRDMLVVYQAMYGDYKIYARPLSGFLEKVDKAKYPEASQEYRFEPLCGTAGRMPEIVPELSAAPSGQVSEVTEQAALSPSDSEQEQILNLDPLVLEFLDAGTYEDRLNILTALHHRITEDMINVMALATDIEIKPGDVEERYAELRSCLLKLEKFECNRLR